MTDEILSARATAKHETGKLGSNPFIRPIVMFALALVGLAASLWAYRFGQPDGPLFYWGILPGAPLMLLALLGLFRAIPLRLVLGAVAGALVAVAVPYGGLLYAAANYSGGGANIGLGLLLLATPITLPVAMLVGVAAAYWMGGQRRDTRLR